MGPGRPGPSSHDASRRPALVDRRLGVLFEVAQQPAGGDTLMPARVFAGDQDRQLERIAEAERRYLRTRQGNRGVRAPPHEGA